MSNSQLAAYEQVKAFIQGHIASGNWKPGDAVPSESSLMLQFGLSRMTVNRALRELRAEGLVLRKQGSGTTVAALHRISSRLAIRDIHDEIAERGHSHASQVLVHAAKPATAEVAEALGLALGQTVFHAVLVHLENSVPLQYEDRHVNPAAAPDFMGIDLHTTTPARHLLDCAPLTEASYRIEAALPSPFEAKQLNIGRTEPCLVMHRRTVSGPNVASVARLVYPGTRHSFAGQFQA